MSKYGDIDGQGTITPLPADFSISGQVQGDILYFNGTNWVRLAPGTSGQVLKTQGAAANPVYGLAQDLQIASQSIGSMLYFDGTNWIRLAPGTAGQLLQANGAAAPTWVAAPSGGLDTSTICVVRPPSNFSVPINGFNQNITRYDFTTEELDVGGNYSGSTYTCPSNGYYEVSMSYVMSKGPTDTYPVGGEWFHPYISTTSGSIYLAHTSYQWGTGSNYTPSANCVFLLSTGNTIRAILNAGSGGNSGGTTYYVSSQSRLSIKKIG